MREEELEVAIKVRLTHSTHIKSVRLNANVALGCKNGRVVSARSVTRHRDSRGTYSTYSTYPPH